MTLLERAETVVHMASQAEVVASRATVAEVVQEVAVQVRELRLRLVDATVRRGVLRTHSTGVADWPDPTKALTALTAFQVTIQADPTGGKAELRRLVTALTKVVESAEQSLSIALEGCRKSLREDARALDDLGSVEGFVERVATAKQDVEALLAQDWKRAGGEVLARLFVRRSDIQKRFDSLTRADVPKAVRTFFRAARSGGAALDLLTDEVATWLDENGQRDRVRLVIR